MVNWRCARLLLCMLASLPFALACTAASRMGGASVEAADGLPCFSLATSERPSGSAVRLYSMHVHRYESRAGDAVWSFELPFDGPGVEVPAGRCIVYGRAPAEAVRTQAAGHLVPGVRYLISIGAASSGSPSSTQGYQAEFCLVAMPGGGTQIRQVQWDPFSRQWRREVCVAP